jgi:phytoene dehydrogenase-like protein
VTVFDRAAVWLFVSVLGALFVLLELGIIGPRWRLFCDTKPCGNLDPAAIRIDLPKTDAAMHTFEAERVTASGRFLTAVQYSWAGGAEANTYAMSFYGISAPGNAVALSFGARAHPVALQLAWIDRPRLQLLLGTAVPKGGQRIALRGRPWHCDKYGCVEVP